MNEAENTIVMMKSQMVDQMPELTTDEIKDAVVKIEQYLVENDNPTHLMLLARDINYYSIIKNTKNNSAFDFAQSIMMDFLIDDPFLNSNRKLKALEVDENYIEIWFGDQFFALFDCDDFIVNV